MHFHIRISGLLFYIMRYFLSEYCEKCQLKKRLQQRAAFNSTFIVLFQKLQLSYLSLCSD